MDWIEPWLDLVGADWLGEDNFGPLESQKELQNLQLGGGFKYFLFSPLFGEDSHFD